MSHERLHSLNSARVEFGHGTTIGRDFRAVSYANDSTECRVVIGEWCSISDDVEVLLGGEHHLDRPSTSPKGNPRYQTFGKGDVLIGDDVWIGRGARILSGVTIGDHAVVGAYSVVASDVKPYEVVVGNPAKVVKYRSSPI